MRVEGFRARFPTLQGSTYRDILGDMPEAWQERLAIGDEATEAHAVGQEEATGGKGAGKKEKLFRQVVLLSFTLFREEHGRALHLGRAALGGTPQARPASSC